MTDVFFIVLILLALALLIWALTDVFQSDFKSVGLKVFWMVVMLIVPIFGAVFYFAMKNQLNNRSLMTSKRRKSFDPKFNGKQNRLN